MRRIGPLNGVQVVSNQLFIVPVSFREIIQARCNLKLLRIELFLQLLKRFKCVPSAIGRAFDNAGAEQALALLARVRGLLRSPCLSDGRLLLLTLLALLGQLLEVNVKLTRIVVGLHEGLHFGRETFRVLEAIAALRPGFYFLLQSLIEHVSEVVVGMLGFLVDLGALVPPLTIVSHRVEGV